MRTLTKRARPGVAGTTAEVPTALPNLVVIGAQKCGTTALNHYLELHPEIAMSKPNELNYFIERRNWSRGIDWYQRHFDPATPVRGDQSPNYTIYPHDPGVPERMHEVIPDAKLIYMIRDPLKRIGAHWVHNYAKYRERGTAAETIMHAYTTYLIRSMYFMQLQRFLKHYDRSRVLVVEQDDLRDRRLETLRGIFDFLGVDPEFDHPDFRRLRHVTARKKRQTRLGMFAQRVRPGASLDPNLRPARVAAGRPRSRVPPSNYRASSGHPWTRESRPGGSFSGRSNDRTSERSSIRRSSPCCETTREVCSNSPAAALSTGPSGPEPRGALHA